MRSTHPNRWSYLTLYKLPIIQTERRFPGQAQLEYDLAFRKDAAATSLMDWLKMNPDLYNFHFTSAPTPTTRQLLQSSSSSSATISLSRERGHKILYCHSWNEGLCCWPFGRCRFQHACQKCDRELSVLHWPPFSLPLPSRKREALLSLRIRFLYKV